MEDSAYPRRGDEIRRKAKRGEYNAFQEYYHAQVKALLDAGVSRNVHCVNIDAVIAALLLKMLWEPYRSGTFSERALETAAFTIFLYPRMRPGPARRRCASGCVVRWRHSPGRVLRRRQLHEFNVQGRAPAAPHDVDRHVRAGIGTEGAARATASR